MVDCVNRLDEEQGRRPVTTKRPFDPARLPPDVCRGCWGLGHRPVRVPEDYHRLLDILRERLADGRLQMVSASVPLESIVRGGGWPDDVIRHVVACTLCGRRLVLHVDTYHGGGGMKPEDGG
ncbi:MAG: hypothetical protein HY985_12980 [Magnetospirillum sp.]|nr:hypothetical protein [Magnetospirillum sp.]